MRGLKKTGRRSASIARMRGSMLIESLVAMLIFLFGVLGLVGLQSAMTNAQTDAKMRADAAFLASDVVGRLWSDLPGMTAYSGPGCATQPRCKEWQTRIAEALPGGTGTIKIDLTTGDVEIIVGWTMPTGQTHRYTTHTSVAKAGG
jgi:type IV pilus assembly protein PilV